MSIRKRGSTFYFDFMIRGVRYRSAIPNARNKKEADQAETEAKQAVYEGRYQAEKVAKTFEEFVAQVYEPWAKANKKTWATDRYYTRALCQVFGKKEFADLSPILIEKYKRGRLATPTKHGSQRAPQSVNHELNVLSRVCELAIDAGLISVNPMRRVKRLRCDNKRERFLDTEEVTKLIAVADENSPHIADIIRIAINTGMRKGEILNLRWANVDFFKRVIYVTRTKTGRNRQIPVNEPLFEVLTRLKESSQCEFVVANPKDPKSGLGDFKTAWQGVRRKAGIEDFHFHDFRHTAPTWLAEMGVDAFTIADILGHSTIQMSMRYTHATDTRKANAMNKLSQICHKPGEAKAG